jgi:hypothetical protein
MKPISLDFSRRTELAVEAQTIAAVSDVESAERLIAWYWREMSQ